MSKIIAVIRNYKNIGFIITPFFYQRKNEYFIEVTEAVTPEIAEKSGNLTDDELSIIKSINAYSDKNLTKIFGKRQKTNDFFKTLSKDDIEKRIRPFIEKQLVIVIDKIKEAGLLLYLRKDKFTTLYPEDEIEIKTEPAKTVFNIEKTENGTKYYLSVKHKDKIVSLFGKTGIILTNEPCRLVLENKMYFFDDIDGKKLLPFFSKEQLLIPAGFEKKWFEVFAFKAMKKYHVKPSGFSVTEKTENFKPRVSLEKDWKGEYTFLLFFKYESGEYQYGLPCEPKLFFDEDKFSFMKILRNEKAESQLVEKIKLAGLIEQNGGTFKISYSGKDIGIQRHNSILWLKENKLVFEENEIEIKQNFFKTEYFTEEISLEIKAENGKDWFDIYGTVSFGKFKIPFIQLKSNILNNNREFILPDNTIAIIPDEWFAKYGDLFLLGEENKKGLKIGKTHFTALDKSDIQGIDDSYKENFKKLLTFNDYSVTMPLNIKAELRPYQKDGFKRMTFLRNADFGVCLADDMGLGKTLQTITLLQDTINERKENKKNYSIKDRKQEQLSLFYEPDEKNKYTKKASLIVMPVSLIHNWFNEIKHFAPDLKALKYVGNKRQNYIRKFDNFDVVLSSYATVRNDIELIKEHEFLYVILDESQFIKNSASKTYRAILELESEFRAVLTGTPIENSLSDLWSQMNFLNDGMLGSKTFFREIFIKPIEKEHDEISEQKLKSIINPFIIRRTKKEVAKDLPELAEQVIYCVADEEQKSVYEKEKSKIRNKLLELAETGQKKNISAEVLSALMKLRQISNHPILVDENYKSESGKFNEVIRNIKNLISENHKVLIFSSFVKHLNLFSSYFDKNNIKYSQLTGKTKDREKVVSEFQDNKENKVFLISIKAGGTGLNLTEADYVFILDPWWNPAVEKQAVNRAHRIGQKRNVMVYKYITENTVEEKILKLQNEKSELANLIVNNENPLGKLSEEMLFALFE
ncbi:MAG: DEAD/DEAH box helicase [Chlorobi bacterium]|nr:DEAD/DEAH box helicase [Chlorobiota bacterium]